MLMKLNLENKGKPQEILIVSQQVQLCFHEDSNLRPLLF